MKKFKHQPVMLEEVISALEVESGQWYLDATFGAGGHTQAILEAGGKVVSLDFDQDAIEAGQKKFAEAIENGLLILKRENFDQLKKIVKKLQQQNLIENIQGVLFDFGTTSDQLTSKKRGLSFQGDTEELDMRLDQRLAVKAKDLLAVMPQAQLQKVFSEFGGEHEAKSISQAIVEKRKGNQLITTVGELVALIEKVKKHPPRHIHPATKVFQALRIAINDELSNIERALPQALEILKPRGILLTIAFHQGEDRLAKNFFRDWEKEEQGQRINKNVIIASEQELAKNARARSAKLRIFRKSSL